MERRSHIEKVFPLLDLRTSFRVVLTSVQVLIAWGFDNSGLAKMKLWTWGKFFQL